MEQKHAVKYANFVRVSSVTEGLFRLNLRQSVNSLVMPRVAL